MHTFIALLRGINVNGQKIVPMEKLRTLFADLDLTGVTTFIQSGNVIFQSREVKGLILEKRIAASVRDIFGFTVPVIVKTKKEWMEMIVKNPFVGRKGVDESFLHVTVLSDAPSRSVIDEIMAGEYGGDECSISGKCVYLSCPGGYGKTKLSNTFFEKKTGLTATTRNWRTVLKLRELSD